MATVREALREVWNIPMKLGWGLMSLALVCVFALVGFYQVQEAQEDTTVVRCDLVDLVRASIVGFFDDLEGVIAEFNAESPVIASLEARENLFIRRYEDTLPEECRNGDA